MRIAFLASLFLAAAATSVAAARSPAESESRQLSWGKPGVSMFDYRLDAGVCAAQAVSLDIAETEQAKRMVLASRALDNAYSMGALGPTGDIPFAMPRIASSFGVAGILDDIEGMQYQVLRDCLAERGYRQFRLTGAQQKQLRKLRAGSDKRRHFLHRLASDPAVLIAQGL